MHRQFLEDYLKIQNMTKDFKKITLTQFIMLVVNGIRIKLHL